MENLLLDAGDLAHYGYSRPRIERTSSQDSESRPQMRPARSGEHQPTVRGGRMEIVFHACRYNEAGQPRPVQQTPYLATTDFSSTRTLPEGIDKARQVCFL